MANTTDPVSRDGSFGHQTTQLERNVAGAAELVANLVQRLAPILRPESRPGRPDDASTKVERQGSPIAEHAAMLNHRMRALTAELLSVLERLDI